MKGCQTKFTMTSQSGPNISASDYFVAAQPVPVIDCDRKEAELDNSKKWAQAHLSNRLTSKVPRR